jgi:hypothetical protein
MRSPGSVLNYILQNDIYVNEDEAKKEHQEYRRLQRLADRAQRDKAKSEKRKPDALPPCFDCIPILFGYCNKTGETCSTMNSWERYGRSPWDKKKKK